MATNPNFCKIVDGPTRNVLIDALKFAGERSRHVTFNPSFFIESHESDCGNGASPLIHKVNMNIIGVRHSGESGDDFTIEGYIVDGDITCSGAGVVKGCYNTSAKVGHVILPNL